ncbi:prolyl oligopeptidase family serine peptidase [Streptomyces sp. NPDC001070]
MNDVNSELLAQAVVDSVTPMYPAVSPDGRTVVCTARTVGFPGRPLSTLWAVPADGGSPPRPLTDGTSWIGVPRWAPDSASVLFASDRQLHRVRLAAGGAPDGPAETLTAWRGGISGYLPLADGRTVALIAADEPDEAEDERRRAEGDDAMVWGEGTDPEPRARLRLLDLDTGTVRTVDALAGRHVVEVAERPDGGPLAVLTWESAEEDPGWLTARLHIADTGTGAVHDLGPAGHAAQHPVWWRAADGWHVAHLASTPPGNLFALSVLDRAVPSGAGPGPVPEPRNLTEGMEVCPTELVQVTDGPPLAVFSDGLDTALFRLDPEDLRFRRLHTRPGIVHALSASRTGETVAVLAGTAYEPKDVHAGPPGGPLARISDTRPELRDIRWGSQERLAYKASDGLALDGLLLLPPGRTRADGPFPMITVAHGGPYGRYSDSWQFHIDLPPGQLLATAGYAVFLPNPRGGEGHGHAFASTAVDDALGGAEWTDITDGIDLLVAEGVADPDRLGIAGWSHGGYLAAWAVTQTDRFKAAWVGAGVSDWGLQAATGEQGPVRESGGSGSVGWEGPGPHLHDRVSPISYAARIRTPVLIVHGEDDANVPVSQGLFLHRALRHHGVPHEFVVYPREGHMIGERGHLLDLLRRTRAWFDRRLTGPQTP